MIRLIQVASFSMALVFVQAGLAQSKPAPTVVSVLDAAKDLAESEPVGGTRLELKGRVVRSILYVNQETAFRAYVADVLAEINKRRIPESIRNDPAWQENRELEDRARHRLLAGDQEGAKQQLRKCQLIPHYDICHTWDLYLQLQFLVWELEAKDLTAALRRFRTTKWKTMETVATSAVVRAFVVAGRQWEVADLLLGMDEQYREAAAQGRLGDGAIVRHLVDMGDTGAAMQMVLGRPKISERVVGLTIIAEGLAKLPGPPDESLKLF